MNWYTSKGSMGQGIIAEEETGRNVAVAYDEKDAPLLAAAPALLEACNLAMSDFELEGIELNHDTVSALREAINLAAGERK